MLPSFAVTHVMLFEPCSQCTDTEETKALGIFMGADSASPGRIDGTDDERHSPCTIVPSLVPVHLL
jgi:hypothetical protein